MTKKYVDDNDYERGELDHSDLIHRQKAYHHIYLKNRNKYPLPFSEYIVHHKNGKKKDNRLKNLEIMTQDDHEIIHGINKSHPHRAHMNYEELKSTKKTGFNYNDEGKLFYLGNFFFKASIVF